MATERHPGHAAAIGIITMVVALAAIPAASLLRYPLDTGAVWVRDPFIFVENGTFYMTGTTSGDAILMYESVDLQSWRLAGPVLELNRSSSWACTPGFLWAPEIVERDGIYHMFYSARGTTGKFATGVAVASTITGPYVEVGPLTPVDRDCIDGHVVRDVGGKDYLVYTMQDIFVVERDASLIVQELTPGWDGLVNGTAVPLFSASSLDWIDHDKNVVEGPFMIVQNGTFHLIFSTHDVDGYYCVSTATATSITGPYVQSNVTLVTMGGHASVFHDGTTTRIAYHSQDVPESMFTMRERAVIRDLLWTGTGWMVA